MSSLLGGRWPIISRHRVHPFILHTGRGSVPNIDAQMAERHFLVCTGSFIDDNALVWEPTARREILSPLAETLLATGIPGLSHVAPAESPQIGNGSNVALLPRSTHNHVCCMAQTWRGIGPDLSPEDLTMGHQYSIVYPHGFIRLRAPSRRCITGSRGTTE